MGMAGCSWKRRVVAILLLLALPTSFSWTSGNTTATTAIPLGENMPAADAFSELVATTASLHGPVHKAGMVPSDLWDHQGFDHQPFDDWLKKKTNATDLQGADAGTYGPLHLRHPLSSRCVVWVNHHYKFILVRNRKSASSTLKTQFGGVCGGGAKEPHCLKYFSRSLSQEQRQRVPELWKEYFVMTTTRNPFVRQVSAFHYVLSKWRNVTGVCTPPTFEAFCRDPTLIGMQAVNNLECKTGKRDLPSAKVMKAVMHDFAHVEPAAPCITTADGKPAVDFVIRVEHYLEDFGEALKIINSRRAEGLPELQLLNLWENIGRDKLRGGKVPAGKRREKSGVARTLYYAEHYRKCGEACVRDMARYIKPDLQLFYSNTTLWERFHVS